MDATSKLSRLAWPFATAVLVGVLAVPAWPAAAGLKDDPKPASSEVQASGAAASQCLIVKHKGTIGRRLIFTALIGVPIAPGTKYDLVSAVNYRAQKVAFTGKQLEKLQAEGVRVTVLEKKYTQQDLDAARNSCSQGAATRP